jgi:hypothetical protein
MCACDSEEREHGVGAGVNAQVVPRTLRVNVLRFVEEN